MNEIHCHYAECDNEAVILAFMEKGCYCHKDPWQWLCAQHWQSLEPLSDAHTAPDRIFKPIMDLRAENERLRGDVDKWSGRALRMQEHYKDTEALLTAATAREQHLLGLIEEFEKREKETQDNLLKGIE